MGGHTGGEEKKRKENPKNTWYAVKTWHIFFSKGTQNDEKIPNKNKKQEKSHAQDTGVMYFNKKKTIFFEKKGFGKFLKL